MDSHGNYICKHSIMGMISARSKLLPDNHGYVKNKKEVVLFNVDVANLYNVDILTFGYVDDKKVEIDGYTRTSWYPLDVVLSNIDQDFIDVKTKKFKEIRETRNHYDKIVSVKNDIIDISEVIALIDTWKHNRGEKYGWQCHAGYDKNFFLNFYVEEKENLWSNFFYIDDKLVGYSIISKDMANNEIKYIIRKNDTTYRNLCLYVDYKSFALVHGEIGDFLLNWGGSSGGILQYKRKFPMFNTYRKYFVKLKKVQDESISI